MKVSNVRKIGTFFDKEKIFLATVSSSPEEMKEMVKSKCDEKISTELLERIINSGAIAVNQYDIFYKDEKGYTRYVEEGPETFAGDNSDGKGIVKNVVPIWCYYAEDEVFEFLMNDEHMSIGVESIEKLNMYNEDYNGVIEICKGFQIVSKDTDRVDVKYYLDEPGKYEAPDVHVVLFKREYRKGKMVYPLDLSTITTLSNANYLNEVSDEKFREALEKVAGISAAEIYMTSAAQDIILSYLDPQ